MSSADPSDPGAGRRARPDIFPRLEPLGDTALRIVLGDTLEPEVNRRVCALADRIAAAAAEGRLPGIVDVLPAFAAIGIHYRPAAVADGGGIGPYAALARRLAEWVDAPVEPDVVTDGIAADAAVHADVDPAHKTADDRTTDARPRLFEIPVCYGGDFGPDLAEIAARTGHTPDELIALHQRPSEAQRVYLIGFAPGNPYVGRLDPPFAQPRRASPRTRLPVGSVCIANRQTVVYPLAAPGGWHMIGRTPLRLFDAARAEPCRLRAGDRIRFVAIDAATYARTSEHV